MEGTVPSGPSRDAGHVKRGTRAQGPTRRLGMTPRDDVLKPPGKEARISDHLRTLARTVVAVITSAAATPRTRTGPFRAVEHIRPPAARRHRETKSAGPAGVDTPSPRLRNREGRQKGARP